MTNDAKMALVIGVGLVVVVAVVFFHKDLVSHRAPDDRPPANVVTPPGSPPEAPDSGQRRTVAGRTTSRVATPTAARRHTVTEGDTLYGLAEQYFGDGERFVQLYQYNRAVLKRPDQLEVGTVLLIPDLPEESDVP